MQVLFNLHNLILNNILVFNPLLKCLLQTWNAWKNTSESNQNTSKVFTCNIVAMFKFWSESKFHSQTSITNSIFEVSLSQLITSHLDKDLSDAYNRTPIIISWIYMIRVRGMHIIVGNTYNYPWTAHVHLRLSSTF